MMVSLLTQICVTRPQWVNQQDVLPLKNVSTFYTRMAHNSTAFLIISCPLNATRYWQTEIIQTCLDYLWVYQAVNFRIAITGPCMWHFVIFFFINISSYLIQTHLSKYIIEWYLPYGLIYWGLNEMDVMLKTFSDAFPWKQISTYWLNFDWHFILRVEMKTMHGPDQFWPICTS